MTTRTPYFIANWKMNHGPAELSAFIDGFQTTLGHVKDAEMGIAPQAPLLPELVRLLKGKAFAVAQNCGPKDHGAFTGEVSAALLHQLGVHWTLIGHSERRHVFGEALTLVEERTRAAFKAHVGVVLCVGETLDERKANRTWQVIESQLQFLGQMRSELGHAALVLAYEPVWAIGTGENATPEQAQEVHRQIRGWARDHLGSEFAHGLRILYGGSVKPENAGTLMHQPDLDGLLVGGASLSPSSFAEILKAGVESSNRRKKA